MAIRREKDPGSELSMVGLPLHRMPERYLLQPLSVFFFFFLDFSLLDKI